MLIFEIKLEDNTVIGADAKGPMLVGLTRSYPEYGYTVENCKIIAVQSAASIEHPLRTRVLIEKDEVQTPFFYDRFDFTPFISNPLWSYIELEDIKKLRTSEELITAIAEKTGYNFGITDFWSSNNSVDYSGGEVTPNWFMESMYNSIYWCGSIPIWLHR